jgi:3-deoxy-D-manno-octulosonic-acid transferase
VSSGAVGQSPQGPPGPHAPEAPQRPGPAGAAMRALYVSAGAVVAGATALRSLVGGAEARARLRERRGLWAGRTGGGPPWVWIHGASVGEADIAIAVARSVSRRRPDLRVVVSSMTPTGRARAAAAIGVESRYFPIDFAPFVKRIVEPLPPLLFVAVETEIWPETLRVLARRGVPSAVVNARLSDASLPRYRRLRPLLAPLLGGLAKVCARDEEAASRWQSLGVPRGSIEVTGNIKFDLAVPAFGADETAALFDAEPAAALLLAASTHDGEEALALDAFAGVRARHSGARLVLAPRHPRRSPAVAALVRSRGLAAVAWSDLDGSLDAGAWPSGIDVVVVDKLGLLRRAYAAAAAAYVGGSWAPGPGGHNLLEGVAEGCPVGAGPHLGNVADQAAVLGECDALRVVESVDGLSRFWTEAIERTGDFRERVSAAQVAVASRCGALEASVDALMPLLGAARPGPTPAPLEATEPA